MSHREKLLIMILYIITIIKSQIPYDYSEVNWPNTCKGINQSPINLTKNLGNCVHSSDIKILSTSYMNITNSSINLINNQKFIIQTPNMGYILFSKYNYTYKYNLNYLEFKTPSEHTIDGKNSDLEIQLVHLKDQSYQNSSNNNIIDTESTSKRLVISLIFVQIENYESIFLNSINNFKNYFNNDRRYLQNPSNDYTKDSINYTSLLPDTSINKYQIIDLKTYVKPNLMYFFYIGSLTNPNCDSNVNWMILNKFSYFTPEQLGYLNIIINSTYPFGNNRKVKPLNGRTIFLLYKDNFILQKINSQTNNLTISIFVVLLDILIMLS